MAQTHIDTEWDFSRTTAPENVPLSVGEHICHIDKATYDAEKNIYAITLRDVNNNEVSTISYYMLKKDFTLNEMSIRILNGLKGALRGTNDGILWVDDIVNGVVTVKAEKSTYNDKTYINVKSYNPVSASTLEIVGASFPVQDYQYVLEG